ALCIGDDARDVYLALFREREAVRAGAESAPDGRFRLFAAEEHGRRSLAHGHCPPPISFAISSSRSPVLSEGSSTTCSKSARRILPRAGPAAKPALRKSSPSIAKSASAIASRYALRSSARYAGRTRATGTVGSPRARFSLHTAFATRKSDRACVRPAIATHRR